MIMKLEPKNYAKIEKCTGIQTKKGKTHYS
jgi:hypothetical protein